MAKYGIREICDVVFKAKKDNQTVGSKSFMKGEPVIYFDTLKTSSLEGAATTVYATGGKGNPRLIAWDGERTLTFNMEDALISPMGLAILTGAGLIDANDEGATVYRHVTQRLKAGDQGAVTFVDEKGKALTPASGKPIWFGVVDGEGDLPEKLTKAETAAAVKGTKAGDYVFVDYYLEEKGTARKVTQVDIEPGKFSGSFYIEGSTLWRDTEGVDHPVEIVIPNGKVQSNFTFTMANSGDPSTFNFVVDALADYTAFDLGKKVLCCMQIVGDEIAAEDDANGEDEE